MRPMREILRLYHEQHDRCRTISRSLMISHVAVKKVVDRAQAAGYTWPLDPECTDKVLDQA
jgi:DNA-binding transcriptional regulator LsrR (DeoR family)